MKRKQKRKSSLQQIPEDFSMAKEIIKIDYHNGSNPSSNCEPNFLQEEPQLELEDEEMVTIDRNLLQHDHHEEALDPLALDLDDASTPALPR